MTGRSLDVLKWCFVEDLFDVKFLLIASFLK